MTVYLLVDKSSDGIAITTYASRPDANAAASKIKAATPSHAVSVSASDII